MAIESATVIGTRRADRLTRSQWRTVVLASLGGALDYFDFVVYGVFARYLAASFFPAANPLTSIMLTFVVYAAGMFARPFGGMLLSHYGDKFGRRGVFLVSLLIMSGSTLCIGLLPTYATWGITATILLVVIRLVQGISVGGELPNAIAYVAETVPYRASFVAGIVTCCLTLGTLVATGLNAVIQSTLSPTEVALYGWRIPFVLGGLFGFLGLYFRRALEESPEFASIRQHAARAPIAEVFRDYRKPLIAGIAFSLVVASYNGMLFAYMPLYLTNILKYAPPDVANAQTIALVVLTGSIFACSWAGDLIPRHWLYRIGAALILILSIPFYFGLVHRIFSLPVLLVLAGLAGGFANGVWCCILADLFPTRVRFTGSALATNVSTAVFSGLTPLAASWLIATSGMAIAPAFYLMFCCAVALIASAWMPRYLGNILHDAVPPGHSGPRR